MYLSKNNKFFHSANDQILRRLTLLFFSFKLKLEKLLFFKFTTKVSKICLSMSSMTQTHKKRSSDDKTYT